MSRVRTDHSAPAPRRRSADLGPPPGRAGPTALAPVLRPALAPALAPVLGLALGLLACEGPVRSLTPGVVEPTPDAGVATPRCVPPWTPGVVEAGEQGRWTWHGEVFEAGCGRYQAKLAWAETSEERPSWVSAERWHCNACSEPRALRLWGGARTVPPYGLALIDPEGRQYATECDGFCGSIWNETPRRAVAQERVLTPGEVLTHGSGFPIDYLHHSKTQFAGWMPIEWRPPDYARADGLWHWPRLFEPGADPDLLDRTAASWGALCVSIGLIDHETDPDQDDGHERAPAREAGAKGRPEPAPPGPRDMFEVQRVSPFPAPPWVFEDFARRQAYSCGGGPWP